MTERRPGKGFVSLVGGGPGAPGLMTLQGRRAIERADVVLYDHLTSPALLASLRIAGQERIHVGKTAGSGLHLQEAINGLIVERAKLGARVVRLKGGDPCVFGRGGEEAAACRAADLPFEIIPGVSSVSAAPAYAGIPVTHRDTNSAYTVVTGHERADDDAARVDWAELAQSDRTLVILMGVLQAPRWSEALVKGGMSGDTPLAWIERATLPSQRTLVTTLGQAASTRDEHGVRPPAIAVVGACVAWRDDLAWYESLPLRAHVIATTRAASSDVAAFEALEDGGAVVMHLPLTIQRPLDDALPRELGRRDCTDLVLTSANGVRALARGLEAADLDTRDLAGVTTWAVGPGTARALRTALGLGADHVADPHSAGGLVARAAEVGVEGRTFLFPAAKAARDELRDGLEGLGAVVRQVPSYETVGAPDAAARLESALAQGLTWVAIASPSAADALADALEVLGHSPDHLSVGAVGPTTAHRAAERGLRVRAVADPHTMKGLASAIAESLFNPDDEA
jgi:uroporphyrinogen III methyltransferase/synthase